HVFRIAAPGCNSRCLLSAVIQQQTHLLSPETRGAASSRAGSEGGHGAVGAPVRRNLVPRPAHTHGDPGADIITKHHGTQEMLSADSKLLSGSQRRRNNGYTGVRAGGAVRIVSLVSVSQYSVRQSRFDWSTHDV